MKNKMYIILVITSVMAITLFGCQNEKNSASVNTTTKAPIVATANTVIATTTKTPPIITTNAVSVTDSNTSKVDDIKQTNGKVDEAKVKNITTTQKAVGFLSLELKDKEVIKNIGESEKKSELILWGSDGLKHQTWTYTKKGIELDMVMNEKEQIVSSITIKRPCDYKTNKNLGIGSKKSEVIDSYKDEISKDYNLDNQIVVGTIFDGMIFQIENEKVVSIFVGAAVE